MNLFYLISLTYTLILYFRYKMNLRKSEALPSKQVAMSSAQRTRKFREKLKEREGFSEVAERERTRKRVAEIRRREKESKIEEKCDRSCSNPDCRLHKERDRKRKYRDSSAGDSKNSKVEEGTKRRRAHNKDVGEKMKKLTVKVKVLVNSKRRLERKNSRLEKIVEDREVEDVKMIEEDDNIDSQKEVEDAAVDEEASSAGSSLSASILEVLSPHMSNKVYRRLQQKTEFVKIKSMLRKEGKRINLRDSFEELGEESKVRNMLSEAVGSFMKEDDNSAECPDKRFAHLRFRLDFLEVLHQKFLAESKLECSYSQFCRLVPEHIVKPKPTDWGTNLCMTCINPQMMLEGLKRGVKDQFNGLKLEETCKLTEEELVVLLEKI